MQLPFVPPGGLPSDESFADAICCDAFFRPFAEPSGFFAQPDVDLFGKVRSSLVINRSVLLILPTFSRKLQAHTYLGNG